MKEIIQLNLDMLIAEKAINIAWLARRLGYSRQYMQQVLHGHKPMSDKLYEAIKDVFKSGLEI